MDNPHLKSPLSVQIGSFAGTLRIHCDERGIAWIDDSSDLPPAYRLRY